MSENDELIKKIHTAVLTDNLPDLKRFVGKYSPDWVSRNFTHSVGRDIIGYCGTTGAVNCARYLVDDYGLDVNGTGNAYPDGFSDEPAIHKAIAAGEMDMVKFLANHKETRIAQFDQSGAPLQFALKRLNYEAADIILKAKPSILKPLLWTGFGMDYQMIAVELACKHNDLEPIEFIVERTPDNEVFAKGAGMALWHENDMVFDWLVNNGVDVQEVFADYVMTNDPDPQRIDRNIKRLIAAGASFANDGDYSVIINALENQHNRDMVGHLVKNGLDVNLNDGRLLNHLAEKGMISQLGRALNYGADFVFLKDETLRAIISKHEQHKDMYHFRGSESKRDYMDAVTAMNSYLLKNTHRLLSWGEATEEMKIELIQSICDDDSERLEELLTINGDFWEGRGDVDHFLIDKMHHSLIGFCLECDSKACAQLVIEQNLCDINAHNNRCEIDPPLHIALSYGANDIAELLLEQPEIKVNSIHSRTTPLERALIDKNYDGARMLLEKKPGFLNGDYGENWPAYHQARAAELSTYGDTTPIEIIVEHTPGKVVFPSAGLAVLDRRTVDEAGESRVINKLFELGLDANDLLVGVCSMGAIHDFQDNKRFIKYCLDNGANFSFDNYRGPRMLAKSTTQPEDFLAFIDSGLDLNADNGTILNAVARELDHNAFEILIEAGCDPALLDDSVKGLHGFSRPENDGNQNIQYMSDLIPSNKEMQQEGSADSPTLRP